MRAPLPADDLATIRCFKCVGSGWIGCHKCPKCDNTGRLFWVDGYAHPYTPEGEKRARQNIRRGARA